MFIRYDIIELIGLVKYFYTKKKEPPNTVHPILGSLLNIYFNF